MYDYGTWRIIMIEHQLFINVKRLDMKIIKNIVTFAILGASFSTISLPAFAGDFNFDTFNFDTWKLFQGAPKFKTENGNYWKLRGRIMVDYSYIDEDYDSGFFQSGFKSSDTELRAARIGVEGKYDKFKFVAEVDFGGFKTTAKDVNISWNGPVKLTVGQMKAGGSLEELTSGRHITFMERAMITDAVGFDRRIGVQLSLPGDNYGLSVGAFTNSIDAEIDGGQDNAVYTARAYYAPTFGDNNILHVGTFFRYTEKDTGSPRRSARWGPHTGSRFPGLSIGEKANLFGAELATVMGAFHGQAEYIQEEGDADFPRGGKVKGGFVQAGYFLTGETRAYKPGSGKFDRTKPAKPLSKGGWGGFEIAGRYDMFDFGSTSLFLAGQKAESWTAGLTWYPESHLRIKVNYTHSDAGGGFFNADGIYTRLQIDW